MIKQTDWVCGNVKVVASLTLPDDMPTGLAKLATEGLTQILQRKPSSAWEKEEAGYEKRPEGFKRNSIAYSDESAERLVGLYEAAMPTDVEVTFDVSKHVVTDAVATKESTELWNAVKAMDGDDLVGALKKLGIADTSDDDAGIAACRKVLQKAKADAAAAAKNALGL